MICKYCNNEISDDLKVCPSCGRKVDAHRRSPFSRVGSLPVRNIMALAVMIFAVAIFVAALVYNMRPDPYSVQKTSITYIDDDGKYSFFYNGKLIDGAVFEGEISAFAASVSGKTLSFISQDGELYAVVKKGLKKISDSVTSYKMSADGTSLVYRNSVGELYLTKISSNNPKLVDYNVIERNLCLSSDGDTVAYLKTETTGDVMYYYNGKSVRYGTDRCPVLISDNARRIYTIDGSMNLYYSTKLDDERLISENVDSSFLVNENYKSLIFFSNGATYLFKGGKDVIKLADVGLSLCNVSFAEKTASLYDVYFDNSVYVYGVSDFKNKAFLGDDNKLYYCNSSYETSAIVDNCSDVMVVSENNTCYYLQDHVLCSVKLTSGSVKTIAENVDSYRLAEDGRYVYFVTQDGTLFAQRGRLEAKEIAHNVTRMEISGYNYLFYSVSHESRTSLFCLTKTKQGSLISENVSDFGAGASYAYYTETTENSTIYMYSKGNDKFKQRYQK